MKRKPAFALVALLVLGSSVQAIEILPQVPAHPPHRAVITVTAVPAANISPSSLLVDMTVVRPAIDSTPLLPAFSGTSPSDRTTVHQALAANNHNSPAPLLNWDNASSRRSRSDDNVIEQFIRDRGLDTLDSEEKRKIAGLSNYSKRQMAAVVLAHRVGRDEIGADGLRLAGIDNYTVPQLRFKAELLKTAGIARGERRRLMQAGIVGRWIGAGLGFLVGGPWGAASGYYLGKKYETGKLNAGSVVRGALIGGLLGDSSITFSDGTHVGPLLGSFAEGALIGAAVDQALSGPSQKGRIPESAALPRLTDASDMRFHRPITLDADAVDTIEYTPVNRESDPALYAGEQTRETISGDDKHLLEFQDTEPLSQISQNAPSVKASEEETTVAESKLELDQPAPAAPENTIAIVLALIFIAVSLLFSISPQYIPSLGSAFDSDSPHEFHYREDNY